jgi:magnesium transporter
MQERVPRRPQLHRRKPPGTMPGTITPPPGAEATRIDVLAYSEGEVVERSGVAPEALKAFVGRFSVVWVNISGLADAETIGRVRDDFGLHWLAVEDAFNVHQRPKVEEYDNHAFIVARALDPKANGLATEQLAMFLGDGFLITIQEYAGDSFDPVRERIRNGRGRLRRSGADYLCYALIDSVVDSYFPVLESYGETVEKLEDEAVEMADRKVIARIHTLKRELLVIRRAIWPHREMISTFSREDCPYVTPTTRVYLRDCYDHTVQAMDMVETYREIASGLLDVYISSVSAKLNEVMKVLTIISTIFMPLSFIASVYGMNFDRQASHLNMPELGWAYGYPFALALMAITATSFLIYFRRKGWIGNRWRKQRDIGL